MKSKSRIMLAVGMAAFVAQVASASPQVTSVNMVQGPNSRLVTITYTLSEAPAVVTLDIETNYVENTVEKWASIGGEHIWNADGDVWRKVTTTSGTITWRPDKSWKDPDGNGFEVDGSTSKARAKVTAWPLGNTPDYMVVDISEGAAKNSQKYYPAVDFLPGSIPGQIGSITNNTDYRQSSIVMRKIMAKDVTWTMGSIGENGRSDDEATHKVTLTNNYYIGVFPVTQCQWALIQTARSWPSYFNNVEDRAMRPVEYLAYNEIRLMKGTGTGNTVSAVGDSELEEYSWPKDPHPDSFLGKLRDKTGIDFDLPSEAEWEFACRAGNGEGKWGDGSAIMGIANDGNLNKISRNQYSGGKVGGTQTATQSCGATNGTAIAGMYLPNSWGLYDFHGNVLEFCLDWYEAGITNNNGMVNINISNPKLSLSGTAASKRVRRGGTYNTNAYNCRSACRESDAPTRRREGNGCRLACRAGLE